MEETSDWIFLKGRLTSIQDVDATLSSSEDDFHGTAKSYVARISSLAFMEVSQPTFEMNNDEWLSIARRLNGASLVLLPTLPTPFELAKAPGLSRVVVSRPLKYVATVKGDYRIDQISDADLVSLRSGELSEIVERHRRRAVLTVNDGHFELPSGAHTSHFFRLAECLASANEIDCLAYWVGRDLEHFLDKGSDDHNTLLVVDNASMLVLAVRLVQLFPSRHIEFACLKSYPDSPDVVDDLVDWLSGNARGANRVYWLVGVSSTGNLSAAIQAACNKRKIEFGASAIYSTMPDLPGIVYCNLEIDSYQHFDGTDSCSICTDPSGSSMFRIDKSRYFLSERNVERTPLPAKYFEQQRPFLKKYGAVNGVLLTHVDDPNDESPRHHTFYVDVSKLLEVDEFRKEIVTKIAAVTPLPDLVVIPRHKVGRKIGKLIADAFQISVHFHSTLRLKPSNEDDAAIADALSGSRSLLVIDDLSFSGKRLKVYNRSLRESGEMFNAPENVVFLPLIALPHDSISWGQMERGISKNHPGQNRRVDYLYKFLLPYWDRGQCPWCAEAKHFEKLAAFEDTDHDIRGMKLSNAKSGLIESSWVNVNAKEQVPAFGKHSFILDGGATPAQILFACASALQQARDCRRLDPDGFPKSSVLDVAVIRDFQNETLVAVGLLRCLLRDEVDDTFRNYVTEFSRQIAQADHHDLWALREFLLAAKRGLAKPIQDEEIRGAVYALAFFDAFEKV